MLPVCAPLTFGSKMFCQKTFAHLLRLSSKRTFSIRSPPLFFTASRRRLSRTSAWPRSARRRSSPGLWQGRVEERRNHRKQPIGAFHQRNVRGAGDDGELGTWQPSDITGHATAEQSEQLYSVLGTHDIGIANHD